MLRSFVFCVSTVFICILGNACAEDSKLTGIRKLVDPKTGATWIARQRPKRFQADNLHKQFGALREPAEQRAKRPTIRHHHLHNEDLPKEFDSRKRWPHCPSIGEIRDQSSCGSCWAFGAVEAMSDRLCIHSNGTFNKSLSATDLIACCDKCGQGCQGGYPPDAWDFWMDVGIVTGGSKEKPSGCRSYPFPRCKHHGKKGHDEPCTPIIYGTPDCVKVCDTPAIKYSEDKTKGNVSYNVENSAESIMREIMLHGPVQATFEAFEDFRDYESGIYFHAYGGYVGGHAIRIVGWGEERGVPYWLIANSWNEDWGENGYLRFLRGENECCIEEEVTAGLPDISKLPQE